MMSQKKAQTVMIYKLHIIIDRPRTEGIDCTFGLSSLVGEIDMGILLDTTPVILDRAMIL